MTRRAAFTFIELIASMVAATVLMVSLLATITIATSLLDQVEDDGSDQKDAAIENRLASDLRYATSVNSLSSEQFEIVRPNPTTGASETVVYEAYMNGLTRQVNGNNAVQLDAQTPTVLFDVDGYSGASENSNGSTPTIHAANSVASAGPVSSMTVELPNGVMAGDVLILVLAFRSSFSLSLSDTNWNGIRSGYIGDLRIAAFYRQYDASTPPTITVDFGGSSGELSASVLAIDQSSIYSPIAGSTIRGGIASFTDSSTHPGPVHQGSVADYELDVQIIATLGSPLPPTTLGMAAYTDVAHAIAGEGTFRECTLAIAVRSGPNPDMTTNNQVWFQSSAVWAQIGIRVTGDDV